MNQSLKRISDSYAQTKAPESKTTEARSMLSPIEKKIRNLEKKLQQINTLKTKLENGEQLEQTQVSIML